MELIVKDPKEMKKMTFEERMDYFANKNREAIKRLAKEENDDNISIDSKNANSKKDTVLKKK